MNLKRPNCPECGQPARGIVETLTLECRNGHRWADEPSVEYQRGVSDTVKSIPGRVLDAIREAGWRYPGQPEDDIEDEPPDAGVVPEDRPGVDPWDTDRP